MNRDDLDRILSEHAKWLAGDGGGRADLRDADLRDADLRGANLRRADLWRANLQDADLRDANLRGADLRDADLRGADLRDADLRGADLRGADLRGTDLDFSCLPLWCGSFGMKVDDNIACQLIAHLRRLDLSGCGEDVRAAINSLPAEMANQICSRHDVEPVG